MKEISSMTIILHRMFSKKSVRSLAGVRNKIKFMKYDKQVNMEDFDPDDLSEFEANFSNVGESYTSYEREMQIKKEQLKSQIVFQKYFKEKEPRFLTFAEKKLIYTLHETKPEEWTIERLSESFPALPETIKILVRTKWLPKSVERVIQYDKVVVENWKKFRAGKLALNPKLSEHLMKFKDRKIIMTDRESLAKQFVPPKPEFKKPQSQLFSSIIQTCIDQKENNTKLLSQKDKSNKQTNISDYSNENRNLIANAMINSSPIVKSPQKSVLNEKQNHALTSHTDSNTYGIESSNKKGKKPILTFNEFVKINLEDIQKESPEEGATLLDIYRKQIDASQEMQTIKDATSPDNAVISADENTASKVMQKSNEDISAVSRNENDKSNIVAADDNSLDTYIKVWNKKTDTECNYTKPIKIAKHLYKPGMTYRINDCYYDDDGTFLYRIPGMQS